jgi:hypothetical protein
VIATVLKGVIALAVLAGLGFLFVRSVRETRSEPYTIERERLRNWSVVVEPPSSPATPMLVLRPPAELPRDLFRQVFMRAMESLNAPDIAAMPLVLQGEFDRAFAGHVTPDALADAARTAGLESAPLQAKCLAHRRLSEPRDTRQLYFVLFDVPAFVRFREQIGALVDRSAGGRADFDPAALSPVLFIAGSQPTFGRWLPLRAAAETDCVAPIVTD